MTDKTSILPDIYYTQEYGKLCEIIEDGVAEQFEFESEDGLILHQFIKRKIDTGVHDTSYFDVTTPYGYGGPVILRLNGNKERLIHSFAEAFGQYCMENNIVSEFIRFHPMINNALDFKEVYDVQYMRHTVATNLRDFDDPIQFEFGKKCRRDIRRSIRQGMSYEIIERPDNLDVFIKIYYETMDRNNAERFYYFDKAYFKQCIDYFQDNIVLVNATFEGKVICSELYFIWDHFIHSHLSGTRTEYLRMSPDYVVMYAIANWGKENDYHFIHTGGGTSNAEDDSLYLFKKKFAKNTDFDFYIGKKIWNSKVYCELCELLGCSDDFFPAYRKR